MAQKTVVTYVDDLTGEESVEVHTYAILVNSAGVEIDLAPESYDQLLEALAPFLNAKGARRIRGTARSKPRKADMSGAGKSADIRAWAQENGHEVSSRGRVPAEVREAYERAH
ncbi:histone-like nucleoid-structuring protein Lsr2 [Streptomyces sp. NPDC002306]